MGLILGILVSGLLLGLARWVFTRRQETTPASPAVSTRPAPEPPPAEPPTTEARLRMGLAQAAHRAFRGWARSLCRCPACGAVAPAAAGAAATRIERPQGGPPAPPPPTSHRRGAIDSDRRDVHRAEARLPGGGGYGFTAWITELRCTCCPFALSFSDTEAPPLQPVSLPRAEHAPARRSFRIVGLAGEPGGILHAGGGRAVEEVPEQDIGARERAALAIAGVLVEALDACGLPGIEEERAEAMRREVLGPMLRMYGGLLEEERRPGGSQEEVS